MEELKNALNKTKNGKAAGMDGIYPEFLKYCGPLALIWILALFNYILRTGNAPRLFKRSRVVAVWKPGKDGSDASHFCPISLLNVTSKLFERMILNRIEPFIDNVTPKNQAGFRMNRSYEDQVLAITTFIESGFQKMNKTAYDTVWREGLLYKFADVVPCIKIFNVVEQMLCNRFFQVCMGDKRSRWRILRLVFRPLNSLTFTHMTSLLRNLWPFFMLMIRVWQPKGNL